MGLLLMYALGIDKTELHNTNVITKGFDETQVGILGYADINIKMERAKKKTCVYVCQQVSAVDLILSWQACKDLRIVPRCYPKNVTVGDAPWPHQPQPSGQEGPKQGASKMPASRQISQLKLFVIFTQLGSKSPPVGQEGPKQGTYPGAGIAQVKLNLDFSVQNIPKLKSHLLKQYSDVLSDKISVMKGEAFHIELKDNTHPYNHTRLCTVPHALRDAYNKEVWFLVDQDIIKKVTQATNWYSWVVLALKKRGGVQLCVDNTKLNHDIKKRDLLVSITGGHCTQVEGGGVKVVHVPGRHKGIPLGACG